MRVVVTGGTGFLGRKLGEALARRNVLSSADGREHEISEIVLFDRAGFLQSAGASTACSIRRDCRCP